MANNKAPSSSSTIGALVAPALVGIGLFLVLTYLLLPAWRRYRSRYAQYLPVTLRTESLRDRIAARLLSLANRREDQHYAARGIASLDIDHGDEQIDDADGEELGAVHERMRLGAEHGQARHYGDTRRLSRELEEGFRDDSSDDEDSRGRR